MAVVRLDAVRRFDRVDRDPVTLLISLIPVPLSVSLEPWYLARSTGVSTTVVAQSDGHRWGGPFVSACG